MSLILFVEDDNDNAELGLKTLRHYKFDVIRCKNGREALQCCENQRFDLVLLDIHLPDINGYEIVKTLRKQEAFAKIPIIAVTGSIPSPQHVSADFIEAGFTDYLIKPYTMAQFIEKIKQYL